jgi:hypothetical protein
MQFNLTAVFRQFPGGYAARANLAEAVAMVLEANRELAEEELRGQDVIREPLSLTK